MAVSAKKFPTAGVGDSEIQGKTKQDNTGCFD